MSPTLYPYQRIGIDWLVANVPGVTAQGRLLTDGRGLGKTAQLVNTAKELSEMARRGNVDVSDYSPIIIAMAPGTARADWQRELGTWWPDSQWHVIWSAKDIERLTDAQLRRAAWDSPLVIVCSIHDKLLDALRERLESIYPSLLPFLTLVDEAHLLKNVKAKRAMSARIFIGRAWRIILTTGTPIYNRATDLFNLLHLMQPQKFRSYWAWVSRYFFIHESEFGKRPGQLLYPERLRADTQHLVFGRSASEVWKDLPPRRITTRKVQAKAPRMSPAKLRLMRESSAEMRKVLSECAEKKLDAVAEYARDCEEPVVLYTYEKAHSEMLVEKLKALGVTTSLANGDTTPQKRSLILEEWKNGSTTALVCTMDAVRESATLTRASLMLFADYDYVWSKVLQCMGRIDPARQPVAERRPARYVFFSIAGGPDEVVAETLLEKIEQGNVLTTDDVAEGLADELSAAVGKARAAKPESTDSLLADLVARIEARAALQRELE